MGFYCKKNREKQAHRRKLYFEGKENHEDIKTQRFFFLVSLWLCGLQTKSSGAAGYVLVIF